MRNFLIVLGLSIALVSAGCFGRATTDANQNSNSGTDVSQYTDANVALTEGSNFLDTGETDKAIDALGQAVKINPDLGEAWFKLGIAYALAEKRDQTLETTSPESSPSDKKPAKTNSEKAFEKAVAAYKKIVAQNDQDHAAYFNLGRAYNKLNEDEDAAKALKQAVKLMPDDTEYQTELGAILIKLAQYHEAVGPLKKALEIDPENIRAQELLEDAEAVHLAVAPQASAGQPTWIAAVDRRWLRNELAVLEKADVFVDRVVPMAWPDDPPIGHFAEIEPDGGRSTHGIALNWAHADGVASVRLQGGLARALVPNPAPVGTRWSATPGAASAAEQWLGGPVPVMPPGERLLQAARSLWNLRQFDLTQRTRGARALRDSLRRFFSPEWRPVRIGVLVLAAAQIVGLNLWAWHQSSAIDGKRAEMRRLAKEAFPRVSDLDIQRDPALVVARETQTLRTQAGKPGDSDFETLLQAAASAWPGDRPAAENLRFEPGRLNFSANGWSDAQIEQFRSLLRPGGWQVDASEGRLTLSRTATRGPGGAL